MTAHSQQLDYAAAPSKKRRWLRRAAIILIFLIATPLLIRWSRSMVALVHTRNLARACARYSPSPTTPIYTEDATEQAQLTNYVTTFNRVRYAYYTPQLWKDFNAASGTQISGWGTPFLHEMRKSSGERRLVGVDFTGSSRGWIAGQGMPIRIALTVHVYDCPWGLVRPQQRFVRTFMLDLPQTEGVFRVLPGQVDPADPSHFTIPYTVDKKPAAIDGWLKDGDTVLLEPRVRSH